MSLASAEELKATAAPKHPAQVTDTAQSKIDGEQINDS